MLSAKARLEKLGFKMQSDRFGTIANEPYDVGKDHFVPRWRDVFIGKCVDGYYITSHIKGLMRRYRCQRWFETDVGNIFAGGATLQEAMDKFVKNFQSKTYNRSTFKTV